MTHTHFMKERKQTNIQQTKKLETKKQIEGEKGKKREIQMWCVSPQGMWQALEKNELKVVGKGDGWELGDREIATIAGCDTKSCFADPPCLLCCLVCIDARQPLCCASRT